MSHNRTIVQKWQTRKKKFFYRSVCRTKLAAIRYRLGPLLLAPIPRGKHFHFTSHNYSHIMRGGIIAGKKNFHNFHSII